MSNRSRRLMLLILLVWLAGMGVIYFSMEKQQLSISRPDSALPLAIQPQQSFGEDVLTGFGPCPAQEGGEGTLTSLVGKYDSQGRYVVYLGLHGRTGWPQIRESKEKNGQPVTFADLGGRYRQQVESFTETEPGPVSRISLGLEKGITRLSLDYHRHKAPTNVGVEVLCRADTLALRYTFDGISGKPEIDRPQTPTAATPSAPPAPSAVTPPSAVPSSLTVPPPAAAKTPPPNRGPLAGYGPCLPGTGTGEGTLGQMSGQYDAQGRYLLFIKHTGNIGGSSQRSMFGDPAVTYVDLLGDIKFTEEVYKISPAQGPGRHIRLGRHKGFTRISFNYRTGQRPHDPQTELFCQEGSLAVRYSFAGLINDPEVLFEPEPEGANIPVISGSSENLGEDLQPAFKEAEKIHEAQQSGDVVLMLNDLGPQAPEMPTLNPEPLPVIATESQESPFDGTDKLAEPTNPTEPINITEPSNTAQPIDTAETESEPVKSQDLGDGLTDYAPIAGTGEGRGTLKFVKGSYDSEGRYLLFLEMTGETGSYLVNTYGQAQVATYVDLSGDYNFTQELYEVTFGPVRQFRFGRHKGFVRLSLTYERGTAPKSAEVEIFRKGNSLALRYSFVGNITAQMAKDQAARAKK
jgi:hypothetical protein